MKFEFSKRLVEIGIYNPRKEMEGKDREDAVDLPIRFPISMEELDMVVPVQDRKISNLFYDSKKRLTTFVIDSISVKRTPEGIRFKLWDMQLSDTPMTVEGARVKSLQVELEDKQPYLKGLLQFRSGKLSHDRFKAIAFQTREFECWSAQTDLVDAASKAAADEKKATKAKKKTAEQTDIKDFAKGAADKVAAAKERKAANDRIRRAKKK